MPSNGSFSAAGGAILGTCECLVGWGALIFGVSFGSAGLPEIKSSISLCSSGEENLSFATGLELGLLSESLSVFQDNLKALTVI